MSSWKVLKSVLSGSLLVIAGWFAAISSTDAQDPDSASRNDWLRSQRFSGRVEAKDRAEFGGQARNESMIMALDWLAKHQRPDGSWSAYHLHRCCSASEGPACASPPPAKPETALDYRNVLPGVETGLTGLALLAFASRGNTHLEAEKPEYARAIDRGLKFLVRSQSTEDAPERSGYFASPIHGPETNVANYAHALATLAVAEILLGSGDRPRLEEPLRRALNWTLGARNPGYGWKYGYRTGKNSTPTSILFANGLLVGQLCQQSGLVQVDTEELREALQGTLAWLDSATSSVSGITGYEGPGDEGARLIEYYPDDYPFSKQYSTNTAAACFFHLLLNAELPKENGPSIKQLTDYPPVWRPATGKRQSKINFVYWFFASQAQALAGKSDRWFEKLDETLVGNQILKGCMRGSWEPIGEWCPLGGRIQATALAALALSSPYRYVAGADFDQAVAAFREGNFKVARAAFKEAQESASPVFHSHIRRYLKACGHSKNLRAIEKAIKKEDWSEAITLLMETRSKLGGGSPLEPHLIELEARVSPDFSTWIANFESETQGTLELNPSAKFDPSHVIEGRRALTWSLGSAFGWDDPIRGVLPLAVFEGSQVTERPVLDFWVLLHPPQKGRSSADVTLSLCFSSEVPSGSLEDCLGSASLTHEFTVSKRGWTRIRLDLLADVATNQDVNWGEVKCLSLVSQRPSRAAVLTVDAFQLQKRSGKNRPR